MSRCIVRISRARMALNTQSDSLVHERLQRALERLLGHCGHKFGVRLCPGRLQEHLALCIQAVGDVGEHLAQKIESLAQLGIGYAGRAEFLGPWEPEDLGVEAERHLSEQIRTLGLTCAIRPQSPGPARAAENLDVFGLMKHECSRMGTREKVYPRRESLDLRPKVGCLLR
jgi:hypothetical protein